MKILVTGGAGFVGSSLIKKLIEINPKDEILSVDNYFTGKVSNHVEGVTYYDMSVKKFLETEKNYKPDIVFHFGEYSRIVTSFKDIEHIIDTNIHSTSLLIEKCRQWGSKLIYSASSSKFGNNGKDENLSPYSWAKAKMVELIKNYGEWYGLNYEIVYFYNVYGPGQIESGDYATVIGIFEKQYREGKKLTVVSPGTQQRDFTHINDIVEGTILASQQYLNHEWYLRKGQPKTIIEIADLFGEWEMVEERRGERQSADVVESDTETLLKWKPQNTVEDYIKEIKKKYDELG